MEYHIKKAGRCKCEETALQEEMTTEPHKPKQNRTGLFLKKRKKEKKEKELLFCMDYLTKQNKPGGKVYVLNIS